MGGAKTAPGGAIRDTQGCSFRQEGVQSSSPNPSLTVHKDKEESRSPYQSRKVNGVYYSAADVEYYEKFYQDHPLLRPKDW